MANRLQGKVAVVTGAGTGIGKAIALGFAAEGAHVVTAARRLETLESLRSQVEKLGVKYLPLSCDVLNKKDCENVSAKALKEFKHIDILVNNAAIFPLGKFLDITPEQWDAVLNINLRGAVFMSQAVLPDMVTRKNGTIIVMSSSVARKFPATLGQAHYVISKFSLLALTRCMASEFGPLGIRVNGIAPGYTPETEGAQRYIEPILPKVEGIRTVAPTIPLGRYARVSDYVGTAVFLASDDSAYITGQTISVDGGVTMEA